MCTGALRIHVTCLRVTCYYWPNHEALVRDVGLFAVVRGQLVEGLVGLDCEPDAAQRLGGHDLHREARAYTRPVAGLT